MVIDQQEQYNSYLIVNYPSKILLHKLETACKQIPKAGQLVVILKYDLYMRTAVLEAMYDVRQHNLPFLTKASSHWYRSLGAAAFIYFANPNQRLTLSDKVGKEIEFMVASNETF